MRLFFIYQIINLTKSYKFNGQTIDIFKNVNVTFPEKGFVAIHGVSGSGKSTLLNLLLSIDKPSSGSIYYLNQNLSKLNSKEIKAYQNEEVGILFQHFNLFDDFSSLENVIFPSLIKGNRKEEAIKDAKKLFSIYNISHLMEKQFKSLSGGEKQRVSLLRALINNPKVILADEPTGALDSKNANIVMEELKKLSKDHLVIIVSHNEVLLDKYIDYKFEIKDKKIVSKSIFASSNNYVNFSKKKSNKLSSIYFIKHHLKKHRVRNAIIFLAVFITSICLFLSLGYINGKDIALNKYKSQSLEYNVAYISKKRIVDVPGSPIKISKLTRPLDIDLLPIIDAFNSIHYENNFEAIFPKYPAFHLDNKKYDSILFSSVYFFNNNILVSGRFPDNSFNEVVVNKEFVDLISYSYSDVINHTFRLDVDSIVNTPISTSKSIKDKVSFNNEVKIVGVVGEFAYLNTPKVYFSYKGLENVLIKQTAKNYSLETGVKTSFFDLVNNAKEDAQNSSYSYLLFIDDINEVDNFFNLKKEYDQRNDFDISSNSYTIVSSFDEMNDVISLSLIVFIALIIFGSFIIILISSFASFLEHKKESAILSSVGMNSKDIYFIFAGENLFINISSLLLSILLSLPMSLLANNIIKSNFHIGDLISIPYLSFAPLITFLAVAFVSLIATYIPFVYYEKKRLYLELKDE